MDKINILNKQGMLTDSDRKQPLTHGCNYFTFESCIDLSIGVKVIPFGNYDKYSVSHYSQDLASFMCWWNHFVMKDLNGFSGFSHVNFELVGFTLVP
jgi:hypothetical protein